METLLARGYDVVPVNPAHSQVLGMECYPSLADVSRPVDVVDLFRRSDAAGAHVDEAVAVGAQAVWTQLGVFPDEAALARAAAAGLTVVVNRCPAQDLPRFFGAASRTCTSRRRAPRGRRRSCRSRSSASACRGTSSCTSACW